jgi:hypothetical protein
MEEGEALAPARVQAGLAAELAAARPAKATASTGNLAASQVAEAVGVAVATAATRRC